MQLAITVDPRLLVEGLKAVEFKQAPFALRWAVNATAKDVAQATEKSIRERFTYSGPGLKFLLEHVRIVTPESRLGRIHLPAGTDGKYRAFVGVIPPEGKGQFAGWSRYRRSLLPMLEAGGDTPGPRDVGGRLGFGRYAIPIVRRGERPRMPLSLWPINLSLQSRQSIEGARTVPSIRGKRRTYVVQMRQGESVVFQRYGRERDATMPLFFVKQQTRLPARRFFFPVAVRLVTERFPTHARGALLQALHGTGRYSGAAVGWQGPLRASAPVSPWVSR